MQIILTYVHVFKSKKLFFFILYQQPTMLCQLGESSEGSKKLILHVSQMEEGTLGFSLKARQLLDCRGQNVYMTLVVAT